MAQSLNGHLSTRVISLVCQSLMIAFNSYVVILVPFYMYGMDPWPRNYKFQKLARRLHVQYIISMQLVLLKSIRE